MGLKQTEFEIRQLDSTARILTTHAEAIQAAQEQPTLNAAAAAALTRADTQIAIASFSNENVAGEAKRLASLCNANIKEKSITATVSNDAVLEEMARRPNMYGRLVIPSVGVNVALFAVVSQAAADAQDSAAYFPFKNYMLVADHWNQGVAFVLTLCLPVLAMLVSLETESVFFAGNRVRRTMKNNGEKLEGLMIAAMLLIFVTSIWAFRDAQRMHEKLAEKVQQTPETAEFAEFVSHLLPATPETAEITPFDASDPHMNFVASKERLKLTLNSCVPLSLDDTTVCIPIQSIGERSLVSYQTQDHTACVGAYHMTLVNGHKEEGINFLLINDSALISGTRNINEDTSLVVTALVKVNEEQQQTKVIQQLLDGAVLCDIAPTITIFGVPVKNNSMIEVDNALAKIETNQGRVFITSSAAIKESKPLDESVVLPSGIEAKYNSTARTGSGDIVFVIEQDGCRYYLLAPSVEQLLGVFGNSES